MNTKELVIKKENIVNTFFIGWLSFLATLKISFKQIIIPAIGQLFGIFMISLAPILEYREMIDIRSTPDGWLYIFLSLTGLAVFLYFLWRYFVVLAGVNLLARDIYDDRAIANLSFYISDITRKKWSYFRFLIGYTLITTIFVAMSSGIIYLAQKIVIYDFLTSIANILLMFIQTMLLLGYVLFSNIAIQGYVFNRIIGFNRTIAKIITFIKKHFVQLTLLCIITLCFSNIIAYLIQGIITLLITNPLNLYPDDSIAIAIRFSIGLIINTFVIVLMQHIFARYYLVAEQDEVRMF